VRLLSAFRRPPRIPSGRLASDLAFELLIASLAIAVYYTIDAIARDHAAAAQANASALMRLERDLGIYGELDLQKQILGSRAVVDLSNTVYLLAHWPTIAPAATWLFLRRRSAFRRYRTAFLVAMAVAFPVFLLYPVAPPRLTDAGFVDTERGFALLGILQPSELLNSYAAMPSLHLCWNIIVAVALFQVLEGSRARFLAVLLPIAMTLAIIVTANHYLLDAVAGAALAWVALAASRAIHRPATFAWPRRIVGGPAEERKRASWRRVAS
jgi:hypothetical protein